MKTQPHAEGAHHEERRHRRSRIVRPPTSPVPFIAAGALVVVFIIVALAVRSANRSRAEIQVKPREAQQGELQSGARSPATPPAAQGAPKTMPARTAKAAPAAKPPSEVAVRLEPVLDAGFERGLDRRYLRAFCGGCGAPLESRLQNCPKCGAALRWKERVSCPFCSKEPKVELPPEESKVGYCAYCGGTGKNPSYDPGVRLPFGMSRDPTGLAGEGCPACGASGRCKHCHGTGQLVVPQQFGR